MKYRQSTRSKTKRQSLRRGMTPKAHKKPPAQSNIRKQAGVTYADIIQKAADKKKKGKL